MAWSAKARAAAAAARRRGRSVTRHYGPNYNRGSSYSVYRPKKYGLGAGRYLKSYAKGARMRRTASNYSAQSSVPGAYQTRRYGRAAQLGAMRAIRNRSARRMIARRRR